VVYLPLGRVGGGGPPGSGSPFAGGEDSGSIRSDPSFKIAGEEQE
jgi:hypothetical protein